MSESVSQSVGKIATSFNSILPVCGGAGVRLKEGWMRVKRGMDEG